MTTPNPPAVSPVRQKAMKGAFSGYIFNGYKRIMIQLPYFVPPFAAGELFCGLAMLMQGDCGKVFVLLRGGLRLKENQKRRRDEIGYEGMEVERMELQRCRRQRGSIALWGSLPCYSPTGTTGMSRPGSTERPSQRDGCKVGIGVAVRSIAWYRARAQRIRRRMWAKAAQVVLGTLR